MATRRKTLEAMKELNLARRSATGRLADEEEEEVIKAMQDAGLTEKEIKATLRMPSTERKKTMAAATLKRGEAYANLSQEVSDQTAWADKKKKKKKASDRKKKKSSKKRGHNEHSGGISRYSLNELDGSFNYANGEIRSSFVFDKRNNMI